VTYSDTLSSPDTDAQRVDLPPPPQQRVGEARQRVEQEQKISKAPEQSRPQLEDRRRAERERQAWQAERQATTAPPSLVGGYSYALPPRSGSAGGANRAAAARRSSGLSAWNRRHTAPVRRWRWRALKTSITAAIKNGMREGDR
jgi:hypothetical protein